MSSELILTLSILADWAAPVALVVLYVAALITGYFMLRDRGNGGH